MAQVLLTNNLKLRDESGNAQRGGYINIFRAGTEIPVQAYGSHETSIAANRLPANIAIDTMGETGPIFFADDETTRMKVNVYSSTGDLIAQYDNIPISTGVSPTETTSNRGITQAEYDSVLGRTTALETGLATKADATDVEANDTEIAALQDGTGIEDAAIQGRHVGNNQIEGRHFGDNSITGDALQADSVTTNKIADGTVTEGKLADLSLGSDKIAAGAITADKLAGDAVPSSYAAVEYTGEIVAAPVGVHYITAPRATALSLPGGTAGKLTVETWGTDRVYYWQTTSPPSGTGTPTFKRVGSGFWVWHDGSWETVNLSLTAGQTVTTANPWGISPPTSFARNNNITFATFTANYFTTSAGGDHGVQVQVITNLIYLQMADDGFSYLTSGSRNNITATNTIRAVLSA